MWEGTVRSEGDLFRSFDCPCKRFRVFSMESHIKCVAIYSTSVRVQSFQNHFHRKDTLIGIRTPTEVKDISTNQGS